MIILGERLRALRLERRVSQTDMSKQLGISTIMISSYELDKRQPSYGVLVKLAAYFGVSTDYLLGLEKGRTVNVNGLNSKEIDIISGMIEALRNK